MRQLKTLMILMLTGVIFLWGNLSEGQKMDEERMMRLLKEFVALESNELHGFGAKTIVDRTNLKAYGYDKIPNVPIKNWDVTSIDLYQRLTRTETGMLGRDPTDIFFRVHLLPDREIAYWVAVLATTSQLAPVGQPGLPEGSWTGLPIGEKSWASAPNPKEPPAPGIGTANLVVWDGRLALRVNVHYQPLGGPKARTAIFLPIAEEDLEAGELAARIILAKATLVLIGWEQLPSLRLVVNGTSLRAKGSQGSLFVPVGLVMKALGCKGERKGGIWIGHWRGKKVTFPIGARCVLVGDWSVEVLRKGRSGVKRMKGVEGKVGLKVPVLYDGREIWVEGEGLAKALGLRLEQKGQTIALLLK
jgi:hypothetical protein